MNLRTVSLFSIISGILLVSGLIILVSLQHSPKSDLVFPFKVSGGSLIEVTPENHSGIIWGQGFELRIDQHYDSKIKGTRFTIQVLNFPTSDISVSGLLEDEKITIKDTLTFELEIIGGSSGNRTIKITSDPNNPSEINFYAMGDTQGFEWLYKEMLSIIRDRGSFEREEVTDFILHLGDITASGSPDSLQKFHNITRSSPIPVFSTPGNHDIKIANSTSMYENYFGHSEYFFEYKGYVFISVNSSSGFYSESSFSYLSEVLLQFPDKPKVIFTHIPIFDPREGKDHALLNTSQVTRVLHLLNNSNVKAVISGHIHYYNHTILNGIHFITSGGGGAFLYENPEDGGFHHFASITINTITHEMTVTPTPLTKQSIPTDIRIVKGNETQVISLGDLQSEFSLAYGNSSFENQYGNWRGNGSYIGVTINDLLETVGGMTADQWITVKAWDGMMSNFSYHSVYPNSSWYNIQGDMILAFSYNNMIVPEYVDGYRIVFLPPDGEFSNEDCENTSLPNEGWNIYPSAGYRWIKYIESITIIGEGL